MKRGMSWRETLVFGRSGVIEGLLCWGVELLVGDDAKDWWMLLQLAILHANSENQIIHVIYASFL